MSLKTFVFILQYYSQNSGAIKTLAGKWKPNDVPFCICPWSAWICRLLSSCSLNNARAKVSTYCSHPDTTFTCNESNSQASCLEYKNSGRHPEYGWEGGGGIFSNSSLFQNLFSALPNSLNCGAESWSVAQLAVRGKDGLQINLPSVISSNCTLQAVTTATHTYPLS